MIICLSGSEGKLFLEIIGNQPHWVLPMVERFGSLLALPSGWDSYGAKKIDLVCVAFAIITAFEIMLDNTPAPSIVPANHGGVQLEWHTGGIDLELEFLSPNKILAYFEDQETGESWETLVENDFRDVRKAIRRMARI